MKKFNLLKIGFIERIWEINSKYEREDKGSLFHKFIILIVKVLIFYKKNYKLKSKKEIIMYDHYISDAPLVDYSLDRLNRFEFAKRIAETIALRQDPDSIVVGIYGKWGEGKSTVLNFIEEELKKKRNVICVRFNIWHFNEEKYLVKTFFETFAKALGKSFLEKRRIFRSLSNYLEIIGGFSFSIGPIKWSPREMLKKLKDIPSIVELENIKREIGYLLEVKRKRVVVLIDDIDRLDIEEMRAVFKLVKISADFNYTAYILAFDDEIICSSFGKIYGYGDKKSGRMFLEKIVQVPLSLPKADYFTLRRLCLESINKVLNVSNIELNDEQVKYFIHNFDNYLLKRVKTPRIAKHYANTLAFYIPLLKGEVNLVDLMLIEGIKVFYPKLYKVVRENKEVFLCMNLYSNNKGEIKKKYYEIIEKGLEGLEEDEKFDAKELLKYLFPRLEGVFGNVIYGEEQDKIWFEHQRITSKNYFDRYFTYSVIPGDISDKNLYEFIENINENSVDIITSEITEIIGDKDPDRFLLKIRRSCRNLSVDNSYKLAVAISRIGNLFPNPKNIFKYKNPYWSAIFLMIDLVKNIEDSDKRFNLAKDIISNGSPVYFINDWFLWIIGIDDKKEKGKVFSDYDLEKLGCLLVSRIKYFILSLKDPVYVKYPEESKNLLWSWSNWGSKDETEGYISKTLSEDPRNSLNFIKCYIPKTYSLKNGLPQEGKFRKDYYDSIVNVVEPGIIYKSLKELFGKEIDSPKNDLDLYEDFDKRVACEFAQIYLQTINEEKDI